MTPNEIISKARGECRHEWIKKGRPHFHDYNCSECNLWENAPLSQAPDYSTDPSAWDSELYQWIEERGLATSFEAHLINIASNGKYILGDIMAGWELIKSTPAQKAEALSKAIREVEGE